LGTEFGNLRERGASVWECFILAVNIIFITCYTLRFSLIPRHSKKKKKIKELLSDFCRAPGNEAILDPSKPPIVDTPR